MKSGVGKKREITLSGDFGDVAITVNGRRAEFRADGSIVVDTKGAVASLPANDAGGTKERAPPQVGQRMPDGSIYAGISPDTGKPFFAAPADAPLTYTFNQARDYATAFDAHGHKDWRVPTRSELNVLFENRAAIGGFKVSGSYPAGWYWSSSRYDPDTWAQRFSDGDQRLNYRCLASSLRCVRSGP